MKKLIITTILINLFAVCALAQTTEFSYQGVLKTSSAPANGSFDFEFKLFDAASGGAQQGATVQRPSVAVVNGVYAVTLDFGAAAFNGGDRFLDVSVRVAGGGTLTPLSPRQKFTSTPYALRSLSSSLAGNSLQLGGQPASDYLTTTGNGSGLTNLNASNITTGTLATNRGGTGLATPGTAGRYLRSDGTNWTSSTILGADVPGGSANYIQNRTSQQTTSNFNISGDGTAGGTLSAAIVTASTQYNIGFGRVLSVAGISNLFLGRGAGAVNTGTENTFLGENAGAANATPNFNTFIGSRAGAANTGGSGNVFIGADAGEFNLSGGSNVFIGIRAGEQNTSGSSNTFVGGSAGQNATGAFNAFFGQGAGGAATNAINNTFLGGGAGSGTLDGDNNTFVGHDAGTTNTTGVNNTMLGNGANVDANNRSFATAIGASSVVTANNRIQLGRDGLDTLSIGKLDVATATQLCINGTVLAACSSSRRYKENIQPFGGGLNLVRQLQPVTYDWIESKDADLGLIAEEVEKIDPLLVTYNRNGEIQGVKYDQLSVVLINAVKEQQAEISGQQSVISGQKRQIDDLNTKINDLHTQIEALKKLICAQNPAAEICR